jgi:hypothetical protein
MTNDLENLLIISSVELEPEFSEIVTDNIFNLIDSNENDK